MALRRGDAGEPMRDLKEAGVQNFHLSESEPLAVGVYERARRRGPPKPDILLVTRGCIEGRWAIEMVGYLTR